LIKKLGLRKIPKRGRIRVVLVLIGLIIVCINLFKRSSADAAKPRVSKSKEPGLFTRQTTMTHDDICGILRLRSPNFLSSTDTVFWGRKPVVMHFSIDTVLQRHVMRLYQRYHPKYGAFTAIEPTTGRVLALVSYTNEAEPSLGDDLYARAIFPSASVFKVITAAGAIDKAGLTSQSPLRTAGSNHTLYRSQLVQNLRYAKEVPLEEAFAFSINPVFARIGIYLLGQTGVMEYAQKFGFGDTIPFELDTDRPRTYEPDSMFALAEQASGFNRQTVISPLFGALIASTATNHGSMPVPTLVDSVTDAKTGEVIYKRTSAIWRTPIKRRTAEELASMMTETARYGTARKPFNVLRRSNRFSTVDFGGKTGNVENNLGRIDWYVGFARHRLDPERQLAVGAVSIHGAYWTVHSSYLAASAMERRFDTIEAIRRQSSQRLASASGDKFTKGKM
jgi:cell division protein FtsI/penicillin-binding protein 2